jgi:putative pre-16S rRNA nuclease
VGRVAAIDFGLKRIGIALSDPTGLIASPFTTADAGKSLQESAIAIRQALQGQELDSLLVGNPLHMDGRASEMSKLVEQLAEILRTLFTCPVLLWDERLTSRQADRMMQDAGMRRKKRAKVVDELAAVILLQSFLDTNP